LTPRRSSRAKERDFATPAGFACRDPNLRAVGKMDIAAYIFAVDNVWWLAGIVGSVWNYAVSAVFTWKQR
jgi:hypothetical protein